MILLGPHARHRPKLPADERGAMALLGLFMAVFLTSSLFYVVGIAEAVLYRERMQDAADAAAFSAAVLHARGMNLIALINQIMAALLAILVALKLLETVLSVAIVLISIASIFNPGIASAIPTLTQLRQQTSQLHRSLRDPIHRMLETLHGAAVAVRAVVPLASTARAAVIAASYPDSPAALAVAMPARATLPTQDGQFSDLCDKAGEYVGDLTAFAVGAVAVPPPVAGAVGDAASSLSSAGAAWFCGEDASRAPSTEVTQTVHHPLLPSVAECAQLSTGQAAYDAARHHEVCHQADRDSLAAQPDEVGECSGGCAAELYELRDALARQACAPRGEDDPLRAFLWQERRFIRTYALRAGLWRVESDAATESASEQLRLRQEDVRPCGHEDAAVGPEWMLKTRDETDGALPLCSDARPPEVGEAAEGELRTVEHVEVTHLFGCTERVRRRFDTADDARGDRVRDDGHAAGRKVPQLLLDGAQLGDDHFQVRALVFGKAPPSAPGRLVEVAAWEQRPGDGLRLLDGLGSKLARLSFAQAEYFYAVERPGAYARSSLLWNMRWQARLRRFRLPERRSEASGSALSSREQMLAACDESVGRSGESSEGWSCRTVDQVSDLILH